MRHKLIILLLLIFDLTCYSQIRGVVIDNATKQPIPYVNIYVLNTKNGATSGIDGKFIINDYKIGLSNRIYSLNKKKVVLVVGIFYPNCMYYKDL